MDEILGSHQLITAQHLKHLENLKFFGKFQKVWNFFLNFKKVGKFK